jgi:hypothetical protein
VLDSSQLFSDNLQLSLKILTFIVCTLEFSSKLFDVYFVSLYCFEVFMLHGKDAVDEPDCVEVDVPASSPMATALFSALRWAYLS